MDKNRSLVRLLLSCFGAIVLLYVDADASRDSLWTVPFDCPVRFLITTPENTLLAFTDSGACAIETETGRPLWRRTDFEGDIWTYCGLVPASPYAVVCYGDIVSGTSGRRGDHAAVLSDPSALSVIRNHLFVIDYFTGATMWDARSVGVTSSMGHFHMPTAGALMLYGRNEAAEDAMMAVTYMNGEVLWKNGLFFPPGEDPPLISQPNGVKTLLGNQPPLFDTDSTMITFMDKHAIRKWNTITGELIWRTPLEAGAVPPICSWFAPMVLDSARGVFYAPCDETLLSINLSDGGITWTTKPRLKGRIHQIFLTPAGILVKGGGDQSGYGGMPFLTLLNPETGAQVWAAPFRQLYSQTNVVLQSDKIIAYGNNRLYEVSLLDGSFRELAQNIDFHGGESPQALDLTDEGYVLMASQNLVLIDTSGHTIYRTYFKMPGRDEIGIDDFLLSVLWGGLVMGPLITGIMATANQAPSGYPRYQELSTGLPRLGTTTFARNNIYMLADVEDFVIDFQRSKRHHDKGPGLVKLPKVWGDASNDVILKDLKPVYTVNAAEDRLFVALNGKRLVCFKF